MDIENSIEKKKSGIDLEESPFGPRLNKFETGEPSLSYLSMDLFHNNTAIKKEEEEISMSVEE